MDGDFETVSMNSSLTYYYEQNQSYYFTDLDKETRELILDKIEQKERELSLFRYLYHLCAVFIVVCNGLVLLAALLSRKRRRQFQHWMILHVIVIHIFIGGVICPFLGESLVENRAALSVVFCKLLHYLSDLLCYMSNVSIALLGIYHCIWIFSPRMLDTVSPTLLIAMLIVVPWIVCIMLSTVLRITMSEEQYGMCYKIDDKTAQILWLVFANGIPFLINLICFLVIVLTLNTNLIVATGSTSLGQQRINVFICVCLCSVVLMRAPFVFMFSQPLVEEFRKLYAATDSGLETAERMITALRITVLVDLLRLTNMILIPLVYLIPTEVKHMCRRLRSKMFCRTVDSTAAVKKRSVEMISMAQQEKSLV